MEPDNKKELVMNAQATQKFLPLLQTINSGELRSSTVNNGDNIGNIRIHFNGSSITETQVKEIGKSLRREIHRAQ